MQDRDRAAIPKATEFFSRSYFLWKNNDLANATQTIAANLSSAPAVKTTGMGYGPPERRLVGQNGRSDPSRAKHLTDRMSIGVHRTHVDSLKNTPANGLTS